eukprot:363010-Chlamydomonas_euryale.AAC.2
MHADTHARAVTRTHAQRHARMRADTHAFAVTRTHACTPHAGGTQEVDVAEGARPQGRGAPAGALCGALEPPAGAGAAPHMHVAGAPGCWAPGCWAPLPPERGG